MERHYPPVGQNLIPKHKGATCSCNPKKIVKNIARSSGRGGKHQGYRQEISYQHNPIEE